MQNSPIDSKSDRDEESTVSKMNFLFFMPETLRADSVGCLGNDIVKTPNMDRIAREGVCFTNCFVQHTVCSPSRCSMFTGLYPHTNGHRTLTYLLQPHERNLFRDLKENGYYTQCFGKNDLLSQEAISLSFNSVGKSELKRFTKQLEIARSLYKNPWPKEHKYHKSFYYGKIPQEAGKDFNWACIQSACNFIDNPPSEPFCLYLPLGLVHPPYRVEEPYFSMYDRKDVPPPVPANFSDKRSFMKLLHHAHGINRLDEDDKREIRAVYYGMITKLDALLGMIIDKLKETGRYETTAIFIFSDHGDYTGDYGLVEKWWTGFQDCLLRVPFIARVPGFPPVGKVETMIEMIDLYPTILELAGIKPLHSYFGKSLVSLMKGKKDSLRDAVFAEGGHLETEEHCFEPVLDGIYHEKTTLPRKYGPKVFSKAVMIRTRKFKYIYCPDDINELYNLEDDPCELHNLAGRPETKEIEQYLKERLLRWLVWTVDTVPHKWDKRGF